MTVQMLLRDMNSFVYKSLLSEYGRRGFPQKIYAEVLDNHKRPYLFCCYQMEEDMIPVYKTEYRKKQLKSLVSNTITHPYISIPEFIEFRGDKLVCIRSINPNGSLKDLIYSHELKKDSKIDPNCYTQKYNNLNGTALPVDKIAMYGRQILEAVYYLYLHYFPYPHLHLGNVMLGENDMILLTDLENSLLGLEPYYLKEIKAFLLKGIAILPEVICFGHVLFEMAMGHPKHSDIQQYKGKCDDAIFDILVSIFDPTVDKPTSIKTLLKHKFFANVQLYVTVHEITLKEKWNEDDTIYLKQVRAITKRILTPTVRQTKSSCISRKRSEKVIVKEVKSETQSQSSGISVKSPTEPKQTKAPPTNTQSVPPPPPPPQGVPPPLPSLKVPDRPSGHSSLMEAIRNSNKSILKKVDKN